MVSVGERENSSRFGSNEAVGVVGSGRLKLAGFGMRKIDEEPAAFLAVVVAFLNRTLATITKGNVDTHLLTRGKIGVSYIPLIAYL